ncbi:MAG: rhomboid family intramembrane serine protease [Candidatus Binatia bacterium]|nr:rhomboid family intramembrane serine protease [Candidatus Binatia bacterium]
MILPLSDAPNPRGIPWMTYAIIAANVAVYILITVPLSGVPANWADPRLQEYLDVLQRQFSHKLPVRQILQHVSQYDLFIFEHGFRPASPELVDLFSSMFLHAGFLHLFGNMLFLWIYGDNVEHRLGRLRFLGWYLATGAAATLFHAVIFSSSEIPLIGASGAISGVLGFYFRWFPYNQVRLLLVLFPFFMRVVFLPARLVLGFYLVLDNILPFLFTFGSEGSGVAFGAHIGGFFAGLLGAWWIDRRELQVATRKELPRVQMSRADAQAVRAALQAGRMEEAARLYLSLDPKAPVRGIDPEDLLDLAEWLRMHGSPRSALAVYLRLIRQHPTDPAVAAAHLGAGRVLLYDLDEPALAYQHFMDALRSAPNAEFAAEVRRALRDVAARQKMAIGRPLRKQPDF